MARGRKKKGKTGQQSKGGGDNNVDLMYLTIMKLTAVMTMTMFLIRTEIMKEAMTFAMMPTMLASHVMC